MRPAALAIALAAFAAPALAGTEVAFNPAPDGTISFVMPSGNVGCTFIPPGGTPVYATATGAEELHCTRVEPDYRVVILQPNAGGHRPLVPGEVPGLNPGPVFPYGSFWRAGAFTCLSARSGLTCINASGAGLRLSRQDTAVW